MESTQSKQAAIHTGSSLRLTTFLHALLFVWGFSLVFVIGWGGAATALGQVLGVYKPIIAKLGGGS